jgi:hypothetical protein
MVHRAAAIQKQEEGTPCNTKLKNDDVLKRTSGTACSATDSLKKEKRLLPEDGPVWLKPVVKCIYFNDM